MKDKNITRLKLQLLAAYFLLGVVFTCSIFIFWPQVEKIAQALTGNYTKGGGDSLDFGDWNNLASDFLDKQGAAGDSMNGPLTLPADPTQPMQAVTKQYVDNFGLGGDIFTNWGRSDCPAGAVELYNGFAFGTKWDEPYGSGEIVCMQSGLAGPPNATTIRDKLWPVGTGAASYTPPGIGTNSEIRCAVCHRPGGVCYESIGSNTCAAGFNVQYTGYVMGGVTGVDNPNNKNQNSRHCVNSNFDNSTPNNVYASVYAGTVIVDNSDVPSYTTDSYINCAICCN